jgi:hypothetical protein
MSSSTQAKIVTLWARAADVGITAIKKEKLKDIR